MRRTKALRPSPGVIVAMLALVVALAGTAIAADPVAKLTKTRVKTIANKEIDKRFPIGTSQIAAGAIDDTNISDGAVTGTKIAAGAVGPAQFGTTVTRSTDLAALANSVQEGTASCTPGEQMLFGGADYDLDAQVVMISSYPGTVNSWNVKVYNQSGIDRTVKVWVLCLQ